MESEPLLIESLFDFFYLDNKKISSFYAQLNGNGSIESYKETHGITDGKTMEATVGVPTVTGGRLGSSEQAQSGGERFYNAIDTMPREMINKLDELGFVSKVLCESNLGRLVLLKGKLGIVDVNMLSAIVEPALNFYSRELRTSDRQEDKKQAKNLEKIKKDLIDFIRNVPFAIQSRFIVESDESVEEVWMTLNRDELSTPTHDINFKHGEFMAGEWYLLGILDALPNDDVVYEGKNDSELQDMIKIFVNELKNLAGRPKSSFGITPIAIFRNIQPTL
ncbi:hypothetical protein [Psychrobacter sp. NPDC077938]|uniref:DUF6414 family protein n=1 Tax=Psychrobacter sp. NPDC077938 TaxID=3364494 RepID=UPI0037C95D33